MKLLYLTDNVDLPGGFEKILVQKVNYWSEVYGYEVVLGLTDQQGKPPFFPISEKVEIRDLAVRYPADSVFHPKNFPRMREHRNKLRALISEVKPDAIFVLSQRALQLIAPLAAGKIPTFLEYHTSWYGFKLGYDAQTPLGKVKSRIVQAIKRFADDRYAKVVYLNPSEFGYHKRANAVVIPNFYAPFDVSENKGRKNIVISLGRLTRVKGYDLLIKAWAQLDDKTEGWEMHVYGNGEDRDALLNQLSGFNFKNPFRFFEAVKNVDEKLAEASIYAMSSRSETFPMVLLEAMSHALPIVSFDSPTGASSIVSPNEDGFLVTAEDTSALSEKLLHLMQDPNLRLEMGKNAARNAKRFSARKVMAQWDALIKSHQKINADA